LIDESGNIQASYSYDPYGKVLSATGPLAEKNPLRYRGYYYDSESGLYYLISRYYDPNTCRFINADDVSCLGANGDVVSINLFAYCGNNPVVRKDDGGEFWHLIVGAIIGGLIGAASAVASGQDLTGIIGTLAGIAGGVLAASGAGVIVQAIGSAIISMASNAAQQLVEIAGVQYTNQD
jgi:RHS repeat-associated protein